MERISLAFITAGVEEGLDLNGARRDGVGLLYSNVRTGERVSAARGYLHPALHRTCLTVLTGATARHVVIHNHAAIGVEYTDAEGRQQRADTLGRPVRRIAAHSAPISCCPASAPLPTRRTRHLRQPPRHD